MLHLALHIFRHTIPPQARPNSPVVLHSRICTSSETTSARTRIATIIDPNRAKIVQRPSPMRYLKSIAKACAVGHRFPARLELTIPNLFGQCLRAYGAGVTGIGITPNRIACNAGNAGKLPDRKFRQLNRVRFTVLAVFSGDESGHFLRSMHYHTTTIKWC